MTCNYVSGQCPYITPCKECPVKVDVNSIGYLQAQAEIVNRIVPRYGAATSGHADETAIEDEELQLARELDVALAAAGIVPTIVRTSGSVFADLGLPEPTPEEIEQQRQGWAQSCVGKPGDRQARPQLPSDRTTRKATPIWSGFINYFPLAISAVAQLSFSANEVHNPGEALHWSKDKSNDHKDCMGRHLVEIDEYDSEPDHDYHYLHAVKNAWRAMAHLQTLLESGKAPRVKKGEL